jgi:hypothetical protein
VRCAFLPASTDQEVTKSMSDLAFNIHGEPFDVSPLAASWRVRRIKAKGAPEVVYGRDGAPLVLAVDADLEDLKREASTPGRYRLDPIDDHQRLIEGAQPAYLYVHPDTPSELVPVAAQNGTAPADSALIEAMRMNTALAQSVIERFPAMMESAAVLLRAADGAGLPARLPVIAVDAECDDDGDDSEDEAPRAAGFDLSALVAQIVPAIAAGLSTGRLKVPGLGAMLDWRKAAPDSTATATDAAPVSCATPTEPARTPVAESSALPALDPIATAHLVAIQQALSIDERALAQALVSELKPAELRAWMAELAKLSVPAAVTKIRAILRRDTRAGVVS